PAPSATNPNEPSPSWASPTSPTSTELDQALLEQKSGLLPVLHLAQLDELILERCELPGEALLDLNLRATGGQLGGQGFALLDETLVLDAELRIDQSERRCGSLRTLISAFKVDVKAIICSVVPSSAMRRTA
ncbi:hypothetical protein, partial [Streptomyces canus]|uniref:hypothetical protein n=1 Tax=Streptomyces canus TaxID=58343 RepID=UPI00342E61AD